MELKRGTLLNDFEGNEFILEKSVKSEVIKKNGGLYVVNILNQKFTIPEVVFSNMDKIQSDIDFYKSNINTFGDADEKFFLAANHFPNSKMRGKIAQRVSTPDLLNSVVDRFQDKTDFIKKAQCVEKFMQDKPLFSKEKRGLMDFYKDFSTSVSIELGFNKGYLDNRFLGLSAFYLVDSGMLGVIQSDDIIKSLDDRDMIAKIDFKKAKEVLMNFAEEMSKYIGTVDLSRDQWSQIIKSKRNFSGLTKVKVTDKNGHSVYRWVRSNREPEKSKEYKYNKYMKKTLGIPRERMPQVSSKDLDDYLSHFEKNVKVLRTKMKVKDIKIAQQSINEKKLQKRLDEKVPYKDKTFIISADKYLLDGNHTWAQAIEENPDAEVKVAKILLPIKKLIANSNKMKITKNKDLQGNLTKAEEKILYELQSFDENSIVLAKRLKSEGDFTSLNPMIKLAVDEIISFC